MKMYIKASLEDQINSQVIFTVMNFIQLTDGAKNQRKSLKPEDFSKYLSPATQNSPDEEDTEPEVIKK